MSVQKVQVPPQTFLLLVFFLVVTKSSNSATLAKNAVLSLLGMELTNGNSAFIASTARLRTKTSKCKCGPVSRPVHPLAQFSAHVYAITFLYQETTQVNVKV